MPLPKNKKLIFKSLFKPKYCIIREFELDNDFNEVMVKYLLKRKYLFYWWFINTDGHFCSNSYQYIKLRHQSISDILILITKLESRKLIELKFSGHQINEDLHWII